MEDIAKIPEKTGKKVNKYSLIDRVNGFVNEWDQTFFFTSYNVKDHRMPAWKKTLPSTWKKNFLGLLRASRVQENFFFFFNKNISKDDER